MPRGITIPWDNDTTRRAIDLLSTGITYREASEIMGVPYYTFQTRLRKSGIERRKRKAATIIMPTDKALLGYIAGIIDGEGSICSTNVGGAERWTVCVYGTEEALMDVFKSLRGGRCLVRKIKPNPVFKTMKTQYGWVINASMDIIIFLEAISPYLVIKKKKAEEAIKYLRGRFTT